MVVGEAVLEAVRSVAFVAVYAGDEGSIDEGFAGGVCALLLVGEDVWFGGERIVAFWALVRRGAIAGPFAGFGAFVGGFGTVVEAELAGGKVVLVRLWMDGWDVRDVPVLTLYNSRSGRAGDLVGGRRAFGSGRRLLLHRRWTSF